MGRYQASTFLRENNEQIQSYAIRQKIHRQISVFFPYSVEGNVCTPDNYVVMQCAQQILQF